MNRYISLTFKFRIMNDKIILALEPNQGHALALKKASQKKPRIQKEELETIDAF